MDANSYQDLTALLTTLSSYAAPVTNEQQAHPVPLPQDASHALAALLAGNQQASSQNYGNHADYAGYAYPQQHAPADVTNNYHSQAHPATQFYHQSPTAATPVQFAHQHGPAHIHNQQAVPNLTHHEQRTTTPPQPKPTTPQTNPRTITTWPAAIRHITFLSAQHAHLATSIRKLIANQHDNERQWHTSRLALLEKQKARVAGKRELDDVLRSVGAFARVSESPGKQSEVTDAQELEMYDRKVHRAAVQMSKAMTADLEALGVPFFRIEPGLVVEDDEQGNESSALKSNGKRLQKDDVETPDRKGKIARSELRVLQRRMIKHLEDMYKD